MFKRNTFCSLIHVHMYTCVRIKKYLTAVEWLKRVKKYLHVINYSFFIAYFGAANALGRFFFGMIGDFEKIDRIFLFNTITVALGIIIALSNYALTYSTTVICLSVFGFIQGGYASLYTIMMIDLFGMDRLNNVFGLATLFVGIASTIGPPLIGLTVNDKVPFPYFDGLWVTAGLTVAAGVFQYLIPCLRSRGGS